VPGVRRLSAQPSRWRVVRSRPSPPAAPAAPIPLPVVVDDPAGQARLGAALARLIQANESHERVSRAVLREVGAAAAASARSAGAVAIATGRWFGDTLVEVAPYLPVRDLETLRRHHPGLEGDALADVLVRNAALSTAAVGAGGGALAAITWSSALGLATIPLQLAVEALTVAAIEVKLVAELHEVYGLAVPGTGTERSLAYAAAWANRRGANPLDPRSGLSMLTWTTRARIQRRIVARTGRSVGTATPFMLGAAYGAWLNRRTTADLADELRRDLRRRRPLTGGLTGQIVRGALRVAR